jgi:hypothetical protein
MEGQDKASGQSGFEQGAARRRGHVGFVHWRAP